MTTRENTVCLRFLCYICESGFPQSLFLKVNKPPMSRAEKKPNKLYPVCRRPAKELVIRLLSSRLGAKIFVQLIVEFCQKRIENILFKACSRRDYLYWLAS